MFHRPAFLCVSCLCGHVAGLVTVMRPQVAEVTTRRANVLYGIAARTPGIPLGSLLEMNAEGPVLYGIYGCNLTEYTQMLDAQFETWAKDVPRKDVVVSGSPRDDALEGVDSVPLECPDDPSGQPCKEGTLLYRARLRARERDTEWFVSATEDKYIWTTELEKTLASLDSTVPIVYAGMGCGMYAQSPEYIGCQEVYEKGGMCGGNTYIMSRAALERITSSEEQTYGQFMEEYLANVGVAHASDIVTSCLLYKRNITMEPLMGLTDRTRLLQHVDGNSDEEIYNAARASIGSDGLLAHMELGGNKSQVPVLMRAFYAHEHEDQ